MFTFRTSILFICDKSECWKRLLFFDAYSKYNCWISKNFIKCALYPVQIRFFITSNSAQNFHTVKGWMSLARDGQKEDFNPYKLPVSCEKGTGAIPHLDLMNHLQECNTVSDQIKRFCSTISMTPKDVENRKEFCKSLVEMFRPYFSEFKIHLFGSSINGLGFKGCDADVSIQTIFSDNKEYLKDIKEVPTLESVIIGEASADTITYLPPRMLLRFVRRILHQHCPEVKERILLIKGKCSLLRFYSTKYDLFWDFSYQNDSSLRNTKVIHLLCHLDERFVYLAKFIRYWGKYGEFVGDVDMFNSYAFSLLVVHFLQHRDPPVLPPIQELIEKSEYLRHGEVNDDELLLKDVKKFQPSQNTESLEELLREYFLNFDYSHVMLPVNSTVVPKVDFIPNKNDSSADDFEAIKDCKSKWKNIRDGYRKSKKKLCTGSAAPPKSKYYNNESLRFLDDSFRERPTISSFPEEPAPPECREDSKESEEEIEKAKRKIESKSKSSTCKDALIDEIKKNREQRNSILSELLTKREEENVDMAFFTTMGKTVLGFPPELIVETKQNIFDIVNEMEMKAVQMKATRWR